ncbi:TRAFAC clade GTPase domain-containing protein [Mycolicibacterium tusciae]|uniref:TRAFAC clade GTPase domain-containing protein n=1 Tax=Mycolicibacterium tusciae TaxID=75922 RepID=UPI00024A1B26|nr:hypothetical protein [Mycolicibacterium tusciae]
MDEAGPFIAFIFAVGVGIFVIWVVAVAALKAFSFLIYIVPIVFAVAVAAGAVFAIVTTAWVLWGGGAPPPLIRSPQKVIAKEVFRRSPTGPTKAYGWDWAWPSYLPYQVTEDVKAIYATQTTLLSGYWKSAFGRIATSGIAVRVIATPLIAGSIGLFGASVLLVTTLILALLAIPFALAMLLRWVIIFALRGIDVAYRIVMRSSAKCPDCYEPTTLPSFECPNTGCATVHRDVRPGRLGVFVRRCGCGASMPTMVVRSSWSKLQAKCPSCNAALSQGAGSRRTVQIPVFGTTASGKTRFMLSATVALGEKLHSQGGTLAGSTNTAQGQLDSARQLIIERANTAKTDAKLPQAFGLVVEPAEGRAVELHLYDAAGELFDTWDSSANLRYLHSAEGMVFVVDPLTTPAAKAALQRTGATGSVSIGHGSPTDSYDNAVEHLRAAGSDLKQKSLAVVLTKADVLLQLPVAGDLTPGDEASVRDWLVEHDLDSLMERTRLDFGSVKFFTVDSMHSTDPAAPLSPFHPLDWLLRELKTNLIRPEVSGVPSASPTPNRAATAAPVNPAV